VRIFVRYAGTTARVLLRHKQTNLYFWKWIQFCELNWDVRFEVLTAVIMNTYIFWDITPCSPLKVNRRFGGTFHLKSKPSRKPAELCPACHLISNSACTSTLKRETTCSSGWFSTDYTVLYPRRQNSELRWLKMEPSHFDIQYFRFA
jgi:hypothetical protein